MLNAVKNVKACKLAYFHPAETLSGLISDLLASLAATSSVSLRNDATKAMFVDRKFWHNRSNNKKKCIVCQKESCWSTNHSPAERLKALRKNKSFRQFLADMQQKDKNDEAEEAADELEDIAANVLDPGNTLDDLDDTPAPNARMCNIDSDDNGAVFFAHTRDCAVSHTLSANIPGDQRYNEEVFTES